jgi:ATP-dependent Clp endopeptidase proteolytic subunit ClpP
MEGHIQIYGEILPYQDNDIAQWGGVNLKSVQDQIQNQKEAETLIVHIHSPGGNVDEGFAIHDVLRATGKKIITQIDGMCASTATIIALAGDERRMMENSQFMIHTPFTWAEGDAEDMQKVADLLLNVENRVLDFYAEKTGSDREAIQEMMKEETYLTSDQAKTLNFVTDVVAEVKAIASINKSNYNQMKKEDVEKIVDEKSGGIMQMLADIKSKLFGSKMIELTAADGTVLDFGNATEEADVIVGETATVEGSPADGSYLMPSGETYVFEAGTLTEIQEAEATEDEPTVEDLQAQIAEKDAKIAELEGSVQNLTDANAGVMESVEKIQNEFTEFKAQMVSDFTEEKPGTKQTKEGREGIRLGYKQ